MPGAARVEARNHVAAAAAAAAGEAAQKTKSTQAKKGMVSLHSQ